MFRVAKSVFLELQLMWKFWSSEGATWVALGIGLVWRSLMFIRLLGIALVLSGFYFLGENIIFATRISPYWWRDFSAAGASLTLIIGILMVVLGEGDIRYLGGWVMGIAIVLVVVSGGVMLRPTSLWQFGLAVGAMASGLRLLRT